MADTSPDDGALFWFFILRAYHGQAEIERKRPSRSRLDSSVCLWEGAETMVAAEMGRERNGYFRLSPVVPSLFTD